MKSGDADVLNPYPDTQAMRELEAAGPEELFSSHGAMDQTEPMTSPPIDVAKMRRMLMSSPIKADPVVRAERICRDLGES